MWTHTDLRFLSLATTLTCTLNRSRCGMYSISATSSEDSNPCDALHYAATLNTMRTADGATSAIVRK